MKLTRKILAAMVILILALLYLRPKLEALNHKRVCQAADDGDAQAMHTLALELETTEFSTPAAHEARALMAKAANAGHINAEARYGAMLYLGYGGHSSADIGLSWLKKLASSGDATGIFNLACAFDLGHGIPRDKDAAAYYYEKSSNRGNMEARARLAWMRISVNEPRLGQALLALHSAAASGNAYAMYVAAVANMCGCYETTDMRQVALWLTLSADEGMPRAKELLPSIGWHRLYPVDFAGFVPKMVI